MKKILIATAALLTALNLSGCMVLMPVGSYHPEHGDLVSEDGTVRYIGLCYVHPHYSKCNSSRAAALSSGIIADSVEVEPTTDR